MGNNQSNTSLPIEGTSTWAEFENDWFAESPSRRAYRGTYHGENHVEGNQCLVKLYKKEVCEKLGELAYTADIRASERAQEMALAFNQIYPAVQSIEFVQPKIAKINSSAAFKFLGFIRIPKKVKGNRAESKASSTEMISKGGSVAIQRYLEGDFVKFLSNTAYQDKDVPDTVPAAFSHFTFHYSHGKILVCGLKGVRQEQGYVLTDPAIHSQIAERPGYYGPTDLGFRGMVTFFKNHQCSDLCQGFVKLSQSCKNNETSAIVQIRHSSMFSYEVN